GTWKCKNLNNLINEKQPFIKCYIFTKLKMNDPLKHLFNSTLMQCNAKDKLIYVFKKNDSNNCIFIGRYQFIECLFEEINDVKFYYYILSKYKFDNSNYAINYNWSDNLNITNEHNWQSTAIKIKTKQDIFRGQLSSKCDNHSLLSNVKIKNTEIKPNIKPYFIYYDNKKYNTNNRLILSSDNNKLFNEWLITCSKNFAIVYSGNVSIGKDYLSIVDECINYINEDDHVLTEEEKEKKEKLYLSKCRLNQSKFRSDLESEFESCPITGLSNRNLLIASHIKRYCECNGNEADDSENGLLLSSIIDSLFDEFLLSFNNEGFLELSNKISDKDVEILHKIIINNKLELSEKRKEYMQYHYSKFLENK
ncbi:MAG: HNH endonuclease, partial [Mycoplasma sp.]